MPKGGKIYAGSGKFSVPKSGKIHTGSGKFSVPKPGKIHVPKGGKIGGIKQGKIKW